jgi:hypothetical protein
LKDLKLKIITKALNSLHPSVPPSLLSKDGVFISLKILNSNGVRKADLFLSNVQLFKRLTAENKDKSWEELSKMFLQIGHGVVVMYLGLDILKWIYDIKKT